MKKFYIFLFLGLFPFALKAQRIAEEVTQRKALVAPECVIDKIIKVVGVGTGNVNFENILDEDLNNSATFVQVASVAIAENPIISVKDRFHRYKNGTTAGFCVVASGSSSVLSLNIIKAMTIMFYDNGELKGQIAIKDGQDVNILGLNLIQIPGSDEAVINLSVTSKWDFDEIGLVYAGGVGVEAINSLKIKYAFVGDPIQQNLIKKDMSAIGATVSAEAWTPVLGIPTPLLESSTQKLIDDDLTNGVSLPAILALGYLGGAKLTTNHVFEAGSEIGFNYQDASVLNLNVGSWIVIKLFDINNKEVQSETVTANVLGLVVGSGGENTVSIVSKVPFSRAELRFHTTVSLDLGGRTIRYAFVRQKPLVKHSCNLNLSMNTNICDNQTSYQLVSNSDIEVRWNVDAKPAGSAVSVSDGGTIKNMDLTGEYIFRATTVSGDGCTDIVKIYKGQNGIESTCGTPILASNNVKLSESVHESSGSLLSISNIKNKDNILDSDLNNYAEYSPGLSLADNLCLLGILKTDGTTFNPGQQKKRIGFIMETPVTGLNADVLRFFQIRTYKNGIKVDQKIVDETNAVSVGLIGNTQSQKIRFSIETSAADFDEITLWNSGVLNLDLSGVRIYYPFIENAEDNCSDPLGCSSTILSTEETGATINYAVTGTISVISAAGTIAHLGNLIDNDATTACTITGVEVGAGTVLAIKTGKTLDYKHQLGIILDNTTYLAGINAGNWMTVQTFYKGVETGDKFTNWNVLGLDVIGYGGKNYLMMFPKVSYDEVRITMAGIANVLDGQKIYGIFVRDDRDNDGIPDCQDPESCESTISEISIDPLCQGGTIKIEGKSYPGATYRLNLPEQSINQSVTTDTNGKLSISFNNAQQVGRFNMLIFDGSDRLIVSVPYVVHPKETTWKNNPLNSDWNEWNNWTNGSPYLCTNVIIPSESTMYPILKKETDAVDENGCNYIHFEPNAEVVNTHNLTYTKAWVEMAIKANRYYMLSAPLKKIYTGDMFIPKAMNGSQNNVYFINLDATSSPQNRYNPRIFQRLWASTAPGRKLDNSSTQIAISETNWSRHFNALNYEYTIGKGFSLWVDNGTLDVNQTFKFRFPKEHLEYSYFDDLGALTNIAETGINRSDNGRFIYEKSTPLFPLTITVTNQQASKYYLVGNPFMSHIDVNKFMMENNILSVKVYDGNTSNTVINVNGTLLTNSTGLTSIAPMQSFFIEVPQAGTGQNIIFTEDMLVSKTDSKLKSINDQSTLRITVKTQTASNMAIVRENPLASPEYVPGEDSEVLFDSEVRPSLAVYSVINKQVSDIQQTNNITEIPLGFYLSETSNAEISLELPESLNHRGLELYDRENNISYPIDSILVINVKGLTSNTGRFIIKNNNNPQSLKEDSQVYAYASTDGVNAIVKSMNSEIQFIRVLSSNGAMIYEKQIPNLLEYEVPLAQGINIIQIKLSDGKVENLKILR